VIEHLTEDQIVALRAHIAPPLDSLSWLEHAAGCRECKRRVVSEEQMRWELAGLHEIFARQMEHMTPEEIADAADDRFHPADAERLQAHLASCEVCAHDLREVQRLAAEPVDRGKAPKRPSWRQKLWELFATARFALGTAFALTVVVVVVVAPADAHIVSPQGVPAANTGSDRNSRPAHAPSALAVVLMPGTLRGSSNAAPRSFHVPPGTEIVRARLQSRSPWQAGSYSMRLVRNGNTVVWSGTQEQKTASGALNIDIPAQDLLPGRYVLNVSALEAGREEDLEDYSFHILQ
jgi:hypothetical protein